VNRWRQRLTKLQEPAPAQADAVQNVQNVQNETAIPAFEHFEQIEQPVPSGETPTAADRALAAWGEAEEERAAIVEYDGNAPRAWAEGFARLHPDHPPSDVPAKRWLTFIDDIGRFVDSPFCAVAASFGWGPFDLFGCDRYRPFARTDHAGVLWLLNGDRLVEIDRHRAVIERRAGARQTFRRRPVPMGEVVLAWELSGSREQEE
jgi:hypothetical protein